jgi:hypothetical protein
LKSKKTALVLPEGAEVGSLLTLTYDHPEFGPTRYHGIALRLERTKKLKRRLYMLYIYSLEEPPEYAVVDLESGVDLGCEWKVIRAELCDVDDIRQMINDEGYYDKGEPHTIQGGRIESNRRHH